MAKTYTAQQIKDIVDSEAKRLGVDPTLAEAIVEAESKGNNQAVNPNDNGSPSYGLFMLHKGGELGNLTPEQAFDPKTNIDTALGELVRVMKAHPGIDPG